MSIYMIGYDLNKIGQRYAALAAAIQRIGPCWHGLDSTWLVMTEQTANNIATYLQRQIDADNELLVAKLSDDSAWVGFKDGDWEWLEMNLPRSQCSGEPSTSVAASRRKGNP